MKLSKIKIKNFRSFGQEETIIWVQNDLTGIIGANSSGKTSLLESVRKIFGSTTKERGVIKSDFHLTGQETSDELEKPRQMSIELVFIFEEPIIAQDEAVPFFFEQMVVDLPNQPPYLRVRLEATWTNDLRTSEGIIDTKMVYILSPEGEEEDDNKTIFFPNHKRSLIQSFYVPAIRKPSEQLKFAAGSILYRLFNRLRWPDGFDDEFKNKLDDLNNLFRGVSGFGDIQTNLSELWGSYNKDARYNAANITFGSSSFDTILKKLEIEFSPTDTDRPFSITELGEGYRSLFYLTLVSTLLKYENELDLEAGEKPLLTLVLIEEPENHIAPQLLGRVLKNLLALSAQDNVQVIISSHTPSIISRIDPEGIRHLRLDKKQHRTIVRNISLPPKKDDAYKFIKEAVRNYPEIYFAKLVVLGEGDSEEIIFNKLARVYDKDFDDHLISVAPLGGRFVNHIWKLLTQLGIPHITLLDLDRERNTGGWERVKYVLKQLLENNPDIKNELLLLSDGSVLSDEDLKDMHKQDNSLVEYMDGWMECLEEYDVFFSYPLDLDFMLLSAFEDAYKEIAPRGPIIPDSTDNPDEYKEKLSKGIKATLKSVNATASTYSEEEKELMIWYNYHFLGRGKPATHILAMTAIESKDLREKMPPVLERMFDRINEKTA